MNSPAPASRRALFGLRLSSSGAAVLVIALIVAIDAIALASIFTARREAQAAAVDELARQTASQAKAIEALLATLRADLAFLASSPRLAVGPRLTGDDPLSRRWARLEAEGTLLLFAGGHPLVVSLELADADGIALTAVARVDSPAGNTSDPVLVAAAPAPPPNALVLEVPVEGGGRLRAVVDPARLLASVTPEPAASSAPNEGSTIDGLAGEGLNLIAVPAGNDGVEAIQVPIDTYGWQSQAALALRRDREGGLLLAAVERLASRWRWTVLLNLLVISLGLPLAFIAVRAARRAAALAAEQEHAQQRRQLERGLWRQERLATVGRMASGIAHEINNPLAGMANHLTMLEEELAGGDLAAAQRRAPRIGHGLARIRQIVQRALGLANPGSGDHEPVELAELTRETISLVAGEGSRSPVLLDIDRVAAENFVVYGERVMLGQLLTNLILNAVEWSAGQKVQVSLRCDARECELTIEDRGPGIDPAIADRLFEPFVSSRGSTGLGLAVSLGIAREHGGTIAAENRADGGARFIVRLPRHLGPAQRTAVAGKQTRAS